MKHIIFTICSVACFSILAGCASTAKFNSKLTRNSTSAELATIEVCRTSGWLGGAFTAGIQDSVTPLGELAPGGCLTWHREPGYVAIVNTLQSVEPMHVIIFKAEAGKKYSLASRTRGGWGFYTEPDDFPKELIVYEREAESKIKYLDDSWKAELAKLNKK